MRRSYILCSTGGKGRKREETISSAVLFSGVVGPVSVSFVPLRNWQVMGVVTKTYNYFSCCAFPFAKGAPILYLLVSQLLGKVFCRLRIHYLPLDTSFNVCSCKAKGKGGWGGICDNRQRRAWLFYPFCNIPAFSERKGGDVWVWITCKR